MSFYEKRMEICKACDLFKPVMGDKVSVCGDCGCLMQFKARLSGARCTQGKWEAENENGSNSA